MTPVITDHTPNAAEAWKNMWENEFRPRTAAEGRLFDVRALLIMNGCDCDCEHHADEHGADCERCLACRIQEAIK